MNYVVNEMGGSYYRDNTTTHAVTAWYIPNGSDYDAARVISVFFSSEEQAKAAALKFDAPPEMAHATTIEEYDAMMAKDNKFWCREHLEYHTGRSCPMCVEDAEIAADEARDNPDPERDARLDALHERAQEQKDFDHFHPTEDE